MENLKFEVLQMAPRNTNSVLVSLGDECVIFDPWGRADDWQTVLTNSNLKLRAIYATHGHADHISAAPQLADYYNVPWYLNHRDLDLIEWGNPLLEYFELPVIGADYKRPIDLKTGKIEILPGITAFVFETPGHSAGGLIYYFPGPGVLIIGDTLFQESVGRYDLPGGSETDLAKSITGIYDLHLPDTTHVIHGHGADTTIGELKKINPYFNGTDDGCDNGHHQCCGGHGGCCGHHHDHDHECKCEGSGHCCGGGCPHHD